MKLTNKIQKAINKASELHLGQTRKGGGLPYIVHPFSVAWIASGFTDNEDIVCACFLHDVLEDVDPSKYNKQNITENFGEGVARLVDEVSEDKDATITREEEVLSWKDRKLKYIQGLKKHSNESLIVSCADKIHNLQALIDLYENDGDSIWDTFNAPNPKSKNSIWFHEEILKVFDGRLNDFAVNKYRELIKTAKEVLLK